MFDHTDFLARSRAVYLTEDGRTMEDVRQRVLADASLSETRRRDLLSALKRSEALFGKPLVALPALPATIRQLFGGATAAGLGIGDKTLANIRSLMTHMVRQYGETPLPITRRIPLAGTWTDLLDRIPVPSHRHALHRLATYCTAMKIEPEAVDGRMLQGLCEALVAEEATKDLLGHRHFSTTERFYIKADHLAASRRVCGILEQVKASLEGVE